MDGWLKMHRKILENPIVCKDADHIAVWIYLLLNATHVGFAAVFKGEKILLHPGQLITGRKTISEKFNINESKVQRILKIFENDQQIEQQTSNANRLITILNWDKYQLIEQRIEQPLNNQRTTSEQPVNTNKNVKNERMKERNKYTCDFESFWSVYPRKKDKGNAFKKYTARLNSGFSEEELLEAAKAYAEECRKKHTEETYIKHPATFLSDRTPFVDYLKGGREDDTGSNAEPDTDGLIQQAIKAGYGDGEWEGF